MLQISTLLRGKYLLRAKLDSLSSHLKVHAAMNELNVLSQWYGRDAITQC